MIFVKTVPRSYSAKFTNAWLYSDDVERIAAIIAEAYPDFSIEVPGFELSQPAELANVGTERIESLRISAAERLPNEDESDVFESVLSRKRLTFTVASYGCEMWVSEETPAARGIAAQIEEYLRETCRRPAWLRYVALEAMSGTIIALAALAALAIKKPASRQYLQWTPVLIAPWAWFMFNVGVWDGRNSCRIYTTRRPPAANVLLANRDKLIYSFAEKLIWAIAVFFAGWFAKSCS